VCLRPATHRLPDALHARARRVAGYIVKFLSANPYAVKPGPGDEMDDFAPTAKRIVKGIQPRFVSVLVSVLCALTVLCSADMLPASTQVRTAALYKENVEDAPAPAINGTVAVINEKLELQLTPLPAGSLDVRFAVDGFLDMIAAAGGLELVRATSSAVSLGCGDRCGVTITPDLLQALKAVARVLDADQRFGKPCALELVQRCAAADLADEVPLAVREHLRAEKPNLRVRSVAEEQAHAEAECGDDAKKIVSSLVQRQATRKAFNKKHWEKRRAARVEEGCPCGKKPGKGQFHRGWCPKRDVDQEQEKAKVAAARAAAAAAGKRYVKGSAGCTSQADYEAACLAAAKSSLPEHERKCAVDDNASFMDRLPWICILRYYARFPLATPAKKGAKKSSDNASSAKKSTPKPKAKTVRGKKK
jgi:hypothetical protein